MMYLTINTSYLVRGNLDTVINQVKNESWVDAKKTISAIKGDVIKYYATSGLDWEEAAKLLDNMTYSIDHFTVPKWRQDKVYHLYNQLVICLSSFSPNATLTDKLLFFSNSLQRDFTLLCETGDPKLRDNLQSASQELFKLSSEIKEKGAHVYRYYQILQTNLAKCATLLTKMGIQITKDGRFTYNKNSTEKLADSWAGVFSDFNNLVTSFEEPMLKDQQTVPSLISQDADEDIDDLKEQADRDKFYRLLTDEDMKPSDIARNERVELDYVLELLFPDSR
jgi:hypothetical protein